jgi:uncharacterized protein (DUF1697 family)
VPVTRVVALLRGINVGGHNAKMERLRELVSGLGYARAGSYLASGNLFFDDDVPGMDGAEAVHLERVGGGPGTVAASSTEREAWRDRTEARLGRRLGDALGFGVPVFLRTVDELESIVGSDPFAGIELTKDKRFAVTYASEQIPRGVALPVTSSKGDMEIVARTPREAFVVWHLVGGRPPSGAFPPEALPTRVTTRFFHTSAKILAAAHRG